MAEVQVDLQVAFFVKWSQVESKTTRLVTQIGRGSTLRDSPLARSQTESSDIEQRKTCVRTNVCQCSALYRRLLLFRLG